MERSQQHRLPKKNNWHLWTWAHRLTAALFLLLLVLAYRGELSWLKGSATGTKLFQSVPFVDPLAALEVALARHSFTVTMIVGAILVLLITFIFGRLFCGWICPLGLLLDLNHALREFIEKRLRRFHIKLPRRGLPLQLKYWVLIAALLATVVAAIPIFTTFSPINMVVVVFLVTPGWELVILGSILAIDFFSPRLFCRSICPLGALHSLVGRLGIARVRIQPESGKQLFCQLCTKTCPMGIDVLEDHVKQNKLTIDDPECTRCGTCIDSCLGTMLHLGVKPLGKQPKKPDVISPESIVLLDK